MERQVFIAVSISFQYKQGQTFQNHMIMVLWDNTGKSGKLGPMFKSNLPFPFSWKKYSFCMYLQIEA
jgi:hypothetical protein